MIFLLISKYFYLSKILNFKSIAAQIVTAIFSFHISLFFECLLDIKKNDLIIFYQYCSQRESTIISNNNNKGEIWRGIEKVKSEH